MPKIEIEKKFTSKTHDEYQVSNKFVILGKINFSKKEKKATFDSQNVLLSVNTIFQIWEFMNDLEEGTETEKKERIVY